jgi:hypothetical protein
MRTHATSAIALTLLGCATGAPRPLPDTGPQNAALVACIGTNSEGRARDGYIITSVGDEASIRQLFDEVMRDGIPDTVVGISRAGWHVVGANEKNATPIPTPPSCEPPKKSN